MATGVLVALAALAPLAALAQDAGAIIGNGNVILGVAPEGYLGVDSRPVPELGLDNIFEQIHIIPAGSSGSYGNLDDFFNEGWGAGIEKDGEFIDECGIDDPYDYDYNPDRVEVERFTGEDGDDFAESRTSCGEFGLLGVRHSFRSADRRPGCENAYEVRISVQNRACSALGDVIYRRTSDPDVASSTQNFFTFQGLDASFLDEVSNTWFCDEFPSSPCPTSNGDYDDFGDPIPIELPVTDSGPFDQGSLFQLNLGPLESGQRAIFRMYYGVFDSQADAEACIDGARIGPYSLARNTVDEEGVTYMFGIRRSGITVIETSFDECINWEGKKAPAMKSDSAGKSGEEMAAGKEEEMAEDEGN